MSDEHLSFEEMTEREFVAHLQKLQRSGEIDKLEFLKRFSEWKKEKKNNTNVQD
ncbi:MAG: hypothetical protein ACXAB7_20255 [Candidatus Kariarchaeaceae archaeon]|jgi:hypothetical protein